VASNQGHTDSVLSYPRKSLQTDPKVTPGPHCFIYVTLKIILSHPGTKPESMTPLGGVAHPLQYIVYPQTYQEIIVNYDQ
jgi:hypothetical protein